MKERLDALLRRGLVDGCYPGAAAAVGDGGGVTAVSVTGKTSLGGAGVTEGTRWDLGSLTKILAPTALALLAMEEGALSPDDALPRFFDAVPGDKRGITARHLLTHTGGFVPSFRLDFAVKEPGEAVGAILLHPLQAKPGERVIYSCMGFILLGFILETLYGKPLDRLARERVFAPLGMENTGYLPQGGDIAATEADPATGIPLCGVVHDENARFLGGVSGNAGVFSDIRDMARFARMLARRGDGFLTSASHEAATRCHTEGMESRRGLGFLLSGTPGGFFGDLLPAASFGHTGFPGTSLAVDPETGFFAVLLSNRIHPTRQNERLFPFRRAFHDAAYLAYKKP